MLAWGFFCGFFFPVLCYFFKHNYLSSFDVSKQKVIVYLGQNLSCLCLALAKISEGLPCAKQAGLHELITQADFFPLSAIVSKLKFVAPACLHFDKWKKTPFVGMAPKPIWFPTEKWNMIGLGEWYMTSVGCSYFKRDVVRKSSFHIVSSSR